MICNPYSELVLEKPNGLSESPKKYSYITERHLQGMWLEQKYFKHLVTSDGKPVTVISPGIWNSEAGPDFLKAHIRINGIDIKGDIEIHLMDEGWSSHGHDKDVRYNGVILHISLWKSRKEYSLRREDGKELEKSYLEEHLTIPLTKVVKLIDLNLYPYKKFIGSGRCARELFKSLPENKAINLLEDAALWRLSRKYIWLSEKLEDPALFFPGGMAIALGYKKNTESFLDLFNWLLSINLLDETNILSLLMKGMGFFSEKYEKKWEKSEKYRQLLDISKTLTRFEIKNIPLNLDRVRPHNHPIRRAVYLIKLIKSEHTPLIHNRLKALWASGWPQLNTPHAVKEIHKDLLEAIPGFEDPYWTSHYLFEEAPTKETIPLIGDTYRYNVLLNTFFPILYNEIQEDDAQLRALQNLLFTMPGGQSSKSKYLTHRLFGDSLKGGILKKGYLEQGAFQLHTDFCIHYEASCEGCPFVEKFREVYT